jgi:hypothetical protein
MKGWQILMHSVRQVTGNIGPAIRISGVLFVVQIVVALALGQSMMLGAMEPQQTPSAGMAAGILIASLVAIICSLWIAVAWHRYVLREELAPGLLPTFRGDRILGYFGIGLLIGLIMIIPAVVVGAVSGAVVAAFSQGIGLLSILLIQAMVQTVIGAFALRLSTILPGVALEPGRRVSEGWNATRGEMGTFFGLSFLCAMALLLVTAIAIALQRFGLAGTGWEIVAQWTVTMVGVSILTTLYGHYIEKRPLI